MLQFVRLDFIGVHRHSYISTSFGFKLKADFLKTNQIASANCDMFHFFVNCFKKNLNRAKTIFILFTFLFNC